jgi:hypothetical protein
MQVEELVPRLEAIGRGEPTAPEAGADDDDEIYDEDDLIAEMTMDDRSDAEGPAGLF